MPSKSQELRPDGVWRETRAIVDRDPVVLRPGEVHAWLFRIDLPPGRIRDLGKLLDARETLAASRFVFERDRYRYVAGRGSLRSILGRYLQRPPEQLAFVYSSQGKPALETRDGAVAPAFNLSHSNGWALLGLTHAGDIGVDIEAHRDSGDLEDVARAHFAPGEVRRWLQLHAGARIAAFTTCWSRKEAFLKALGTGLTQPLDRFEVSFEPDRRPRLRSIDGGAQDTRDWTLWDARVGAEMAAAIAVRARGLRLRRFLGS